MFQFNGIIMDNDSTTVYRLRNEVNPNIVKKCDENHTKKGIGKYLLGMYIMEPR